MLLSFLNFVDQPVKTKNWFKILIMKKLQKGFAVFAVSMFMMSMTSSNQFLKKKDCWEIADDTQVVYENVMVNNNHIPSHSESYNVWEAAYLGCI